MVATTSGGNSQHCKAYTFAAPAAATSQLPSAEPPSTPPRLPRSLAPIPCAGPSPPQQYPLNPPAPANPAPVSASLSPPPPQPTATAAARPCVRKRSRARRATLHTRVDKRFHLLSLLSLSSPIALKQTNTTDNRNKPKKRKYI